MSTWPRWRTGVLVVAALVTTGLIGVVAVVLYEHPCEYCVRRPTLYSVQAVLGLGSAIAAVASCALFVARRPRATTRALAVVSLIALAWVAVVSQADCPDQDSAACN